MGANIADVVQKKLTPFKKPKNSGGSPKGVNDPPMFATRKIKNTITCTLFSLLEFALISGLMSSIAAPVVPIQLAKAVPTKMIIVLSVGVPTRVPFSLTPPEMVNKASNKIMNGMYSSKPT